MPSLDFSGHDSLHYVRRGVGAPLLLIQGAAASHLHWGQRLLSLLARAFDVVAYDHRGVGHSAPVSGPFTIEELADDAARVLDRVGWTRADIVGVSMGGVIAQELALRHPDRVRRLVLGCTHAGGAAASTTRAACEAEVAAAVVRGNRIATARNMFRLGVKDEDALPPEAWLEYQDSVLTLPVDPRATVLQTGALARHTTADRLQELRVPTLVIHGEADRMVHPEDGIAVARGIRDARLTILDAGHLFWLEQPEQTADIIAKFCAEAAVSPGSGGVESGSSRSRVIG
ncbi:alpha/beta fold hydrolase [Streptomyces sp. NPDC059917]|uniref:alpha/beta fold hydrolase n=1 Tax=Streptomyces sp. NPDC059917 TaxID=3347002 RepID=UPI00364B164F